MSKLGCICGHVISDSTDFIPYKARFLRDQDSTVLDKSIEDICLFMEAYKNGQKEEWIKQRFGSDADVNMQNDWVIMKIQLDNELDFEGYMYQCEKCGRIAIEARTENNFAYFVPDGKNCENILNGKKANK